MAQRQKPVELWSRAEKAIEIDKTLGGMTEAGIEAVYHCCDVSDRDALGRLLDEIRRRSGDLGRPEIELDYLRRLLDRF